MVQMVKASFVYKGHKRDGGGEGDVLAATASIPAGWSTRAWRTDEQQSWDRPFCLDIVAAARPDGSGPRLAADTGEAFSWFDLASMSESMGLGAPQAMLPFGGLGGVGGLFGLLGGFGGADMGGASPFSGPMQMSVPKPRTGRPEWQFFTLPDYLDELMVEMDDGAIARRQIWLLGEAIVGETEQEMLNRERALAESEEKSWRELGVSGLEMRVNAAIDRTMVRHWRMVDSRGVMLHVLIGAKVHGVDKLCYREGTAPNSMLWSAPFGQAKRGHALHYDVEWLVERRFYGFCAEGECDIDWFRNVVVRFGASLRFNKNLMDEMERERCRLREAGRREGERAREDFHRFNQGFDARMRANDAERQERMRRHEEQLQADRERRRRQDAQMERDRRVRHAWSNAIRGTEEYCDPYGHRMETRVTGPNQRAFYDRRTGRTIMSDVSDVDKPADWEELSKWQW